MPIPYTLLDIDGIELGDYTVRDLTMDLEPIGAAFSQRRDINGTLVNLAEDQFQDKYVAVISCSDQESPVFAGVPIGTIVTVTCVKQLGRNRNSEDTEEQLQLTMMVQPWRVSRREWRAQTDWQIRLESV